MSTCCCTFLLDRQVFLWNERSKAQAATGKSLADRTPIMALVENAFLAMMSASFALQVAKKRVEKHWTFHEKSINAESFAAFPSF